MFDPDLDTRAYPPATLDDVVDQQRFVVNPLLAAVALLGAWALLRYSLATRNPGLFLATLFAAAVSLLLIQYHCLDCGRTDFALRARRHACAAVIHRGRLHADPPAFPPGVKTQIKAWGIAAATALLFYGIFRSVR